MRLILLAVFLFIVSNTYAAFDADSYIYSDDSNEMIIMKIRLQDSHDKYAQSVLKTLRKNKNMLDSYDKSEVVYKIDDISKKDVGAKIGMNKEQVVNKTYWGEPDTIHKNINEYDSLELWTYWVSGTSQTVRAMLVFRNDKLTYIVP